MKRALWGTAVLFALVAGFLIGQSRPPRDLGEIPSPRTYYGARQARDSMSLARLRDAERTIVLLEVRLCTLNQQEACGWIARR
jgi:hypothetical protein